MGRIIVAAALGGWLAILAIAYDLADRRIGMCVFSDIDCQMRATAQRDFILTVGLVGALAIIVASLIVFAIIKARRGETPIAPKSGWSPASRGQRVLPR